MTDDRADEQVADRLRRQLRATARFAESSFNGDMPLVDVLRAACRAACEGSGISRSKILVADAARRTLIIQAGVGWAPGVIGMHVPVRARSVAGATLLSGKALIVDDLPSDPDHDWEEPLAGHGIVAVANVPVALDGVVLGVLEPDSTAPMSLHADDIDFLHGLAGPVAAAIMRVRFENRASEQKQRLRQHEERLRVALGAARMGTWIQRRSTRRHLIDDNLHRMLDPGPDRSIETFEDFLVAIHPDDRDAVRTAFERAWNDASDLTVEFRVVRPDGGVRWIHDQGRVLPDETGAMDLMAGACVDITDRKEAELRLARADRKKTEFLAMLAHELRNPMAPLRNAVMLLARGSSDGPHARKALDIMQRQLEHLARLVGDLLEISRIERGRVELRIAPTALVEALTVGIEAVQPAIDARGQRLTAMLPDPALHVPADGVRITQIVSNLLTNAAKFTPEGGDIALDVRVYPQEVEIIVRDEGIGIDPDVLPHVFDLFEQGDKQSLDRTQGGLGIGLALVRSLVEMHGGRVDATSDGPGRGATFTVRLPR